MAGRQFSHLRSTPLTRIGDPLGIDHRLRSAETGVAVIERPRRRSSTRPTMSSSTRGPRRSSVLRPVGDALRCSITDGDLAVVRVALRRATSSPCRLDQAADRGASYDPVKGGATTTSPRSARPSHRERARLAVMAVDARAKNRWRQPTRCRTGRSGFLDSMTDADCHDRDPLGWSRTWNCSTGSRSSSVSLPDSRLPSSPSSWPSAATRLLDEGDRADRPGSVPVVGYANAIWSSWPRHSTASCPSARLGPTHDHLTPAALSTSTRRP